jgi:NitT/TauT family transport system substrate-binding protein
MNKKYFQTIGIFMMIMVLSISACGQTGASSEPVKVNFAYDYWAGYYPGLIAIQKGYYAESNLEVNAVKPENTNAMMGDFMGGKYDFIAVSVGDVISLTQQSDDIYFIIASDESAGGDAFLAKPEIQTVEDLRGKKVGVNQGGFAEIFIMTVLGENGITPVDVTLVDMDASELPANLRNNTVVAGHTWEPYVTESKNDGNKVLFTTADTPGLVIDGIAVRGAFVREHPEAVQAFVSGWFKAVDFWLANPAEGNAAAAQITGEDPAALSLNGIGLKTLADNQALYRPGTTTASLQYTTQLYVDFFVRNGTLTKKPDIQKLLNAEFLKP